MALEKHSNFSSKVSTGPAKAILSAVVLAGVLAPAQVSAGERYSLLRQQGRWQGGIPVAEVTVRDNATGTTHRLEAELHPRDVMAAGPEKVSFEAFIAADRVVVVNPSGYCKQLLLLDPTSGRTIDSISLCNVSFSPSRNRMAGAHYGGRYSNGALVAYDFTRTPIENASLGHMGRFVPKGIILFPTSNRLEGAYEILSETRTLSSPVAWCGEDRAAFLFTEGDSSHLIELSLPADLRLAKVLRDQPVPSEPYRGQPDSDWPPYRPLPPVSVRELHYGPQCRSVILVFYGGPFQKEPAALPLGE